MVYRRCRGTSHPEGVDRWHRAGEPCPACGDHAVFNKALYTAKLNNHLYAAAERGENEKRFERSLG